LRRRFTIAKGNRNGSCRNHIQEFCPAQPADIA
jgi:hypothetical protein